MGPTQDQTFCTGDTVVQHGVLRRVNPQRMQKDQLQLVCGHGNMSEGACFPIIIACVSKQKRKQRMWMKEWLQKWSDSRNNNLLRELGISFLLDYKV